MRLGDYVQRDMDLILRRWEAFASRVPTREHTISPSLRDHGPEILQAIVADLERNQTTDEQAATFIGGGTVALDTPHTAAQTLAVLRAGRRFDIEQLACEYRALRASVLSGWMEARPPDSAHCFEDMVRFDEALDQSLAESIDFFTARVTPSQNLTLPDLRNTFRRIEASHTELNLHHVELVRLVAEHFRELKIALQQADDANQNKAAFLRTISHELRTPLNAVIGFSGVLLDGLIEQPSEAQRELLSIIERSGQDLLNLIGEMQDITSIEAGALAVTLAPVDLRPVLEESRVSMLLVSAERKLELPPVDCGVDLLVMADRDRLGQVIRNLLSNALKYTDHGSVKVRASRVDPLICVEVEDTGVGIPAEQQAFLFQPFHRITGQVGSHRPGTGLGLAISRRIVEAMGGTMGFESEEGRGSRFWFTVPAVQFPGVNRDCAGQSQEAPISPANRANREELLATVLGGLLKLQRGRVALVETRFTDGLLGVLSPDVHEHVSSRAPRPEPVDSPLAVAANLMLADVSAASRERATTEVMGALYMAKAAGFVITSCCGDSVEDHCSTPDSVLVILPPGAPDGQ